MKSPEHITHGTSSEKDAGSILEQQKFEVLEGRATVSGNLIYAYQWATETSRRKGSKSQTEVGPDDLGRIIIMRTPDEAWIDYADRTRIDIDDDNNEITGFTAKYVGGRKQLGIYNQPDSHKRRLELDDLKQQISDLKRARQEYLEPYGIDYSTLKSADDLKEQLSHNGHTGKAQEIITRLKDYREQIAELRIQAEVPLEIKDQDIVMGIVPSEELGTVLSQLKNRISQLDAIDLESFTKQISQLIRLEYSNYLADENTIESVVQNLLVTTIESEVINFIRSLSIDVKRAQGYDVYNREDRQPIEKDVDPDQLLHKLKTLHNKVSQGDFTIGLPHLDRYLKVHTNKLMNELGSSFE